MKYSYHITPRPSDLGGGWLLGLYLHDELINAEVFSLPRTDAEDVVLWWNALEEPARRYWLFHANSRDPASAYRTFQVAKTYVRAEAEAHVWLDSLGADRLGGNDEYPQIDNASAFLTGAVLICVQAIMVEDSEKTSFIAGERYVVYAASQDQNSPFIILINEQGDLQRFFAEEIRELFILAD